jgi:non-heme chloroperoxidase
MGRRGANNPRRKVLGAARMDAISLTPSAAGKETEVLTSSTRRMDPMTTVTTKDGVQIFYKDWGPKSARPIVFHHGWLLSSDDWENQMLFFGGAS